MYNFCTLFNSTYLSRGLAMHSSLVKTCPVFHLYIFAFDELCYNTLIELKLSSVTIISLKQFENSELLRIKPTRTAGEYCWTCTPSTISYCIETYNLPDCTYIDADLLFFSDPAILINEMGEDSVLITDHRYTPIYDQSEKYGKYCVQFITFKNDKRGIKVLNWWKDSCIEWCYNRAEDNKFGDQKYLDKWTTMFDGVHELQHTGGGVAPWNVQQYNIECVNNRLIGIEKKSGKQFDIIFYHYHYFKYYEGNGCHLGEYEIVSNTAKMIYGPYIKALLKADNLLKKINPEITFHEVLKIPRLDKSIRRKFLYNVTGRFRDYYKLKYFL